ncbi:hypothetical protein [Mesorhizobium sp. M4B.F.Ca.ET.058.02.1.1]|uniref:hypothetical protein n=1 Tax=Mesorhizobium sp. M4B.F.Ca.ET.058.02.1.1 TaxID=2493675 RepID=UPI00167C9780|nr:hypothetical protein [Mesorhizobium sp. M4B.F.Ca.ET.058.02.1.1]
MLEDGLTQLPDPGLDFGRSDVVRRHVSGPDRCPDEPEQTHRYDADGSHQALALDGLGTGSGLADEPHIGLGFERVLDIETQSQKRLLDGFLSGTLSDLLNLRVSHIPIS